MDAENFVFAPPATQEPAEPESQGLVPAGFNERFLAYAVDAAPFVFGAYFSFSMLLKSGGVKYSAGAEFRWKLLWAAAFILYETIFASGGRATLGKRLLGIRVIHIDGASCLSVPGAFVRAVAYFLSSMLLNLGYLMALFTREKRALHDYIAQSRVISVRERSDLGNGIVLALSWAVMAILINAWGRQTFLKPTPEERAQIQAAAVTVNKIAKLEEIHKAMYGGYTDDLKRLARLTHNVEAVRREIAANIAPESLAIASDGRVYIITARAKNWRGTGIRRESAPDRPQ